MSIGCVKESTQVVRAGLGFSVYVVCVLVERHASVICYCKECEKLVFGGNMSVDLLVKTIILFLVIHFSNTCYYICCCLAAVSHLECCVRIVRLLAYDSTCVFGSVGMGMP